MNKYNIITGMEVRECRDAFQQKKEEKYSNHEVSPRRLRT